MELLAYWNIIRKRLLLVIALGVVAALAATYVGSRQVPLYRTTTTLFLNPAATNPLLPYQTSNSVASMANTYIELMRTSSFAGMVAAQSGLALTPAQVLDALSAQYVADTQFFRITATHADPNAAQVIANTTAQTLIAENASRRKAAQAQIQSQVSQDPERQQLSELRDSLRAELDLYNQRIQSTRDQITSMESRAPSSSNDQRLGELRNELVQLLNSRSATLNSLAQVQSSLAAGSAGTTAVSADTAVVVDPAPFPSAPLPQNGLRSILVWLGLGLAGGGAIAVGLERIDYTVKTPDALELAYGAPAFGVIGIVGSLRKGEHEGNPSYRLTSSESRSPAAESIRALRTSVQVVGLNRPMSSLLVTSAGPGEGKTFVAANLAVSMAQYGQMVILVDLDLHKPNMHSVFGLQREPGFTNLVIGHDASILAAIRPQVHELATQLRALAGGRVAVATAGPAAAPLTMAGVQRLLRQAEAEAPDLAELVAGVRRQIEQADDIAACLQPSGEPNLMLLTCGSMVPQPSELLGSQRAAQVMERLREHADVVIYDTPPAGAISDAVILTPRVDGVLQVVRAGRTRIDLIRRCKATLEQAGGQPPGSVLNQVKLSEMGSYSYYGYNYHGYGAGHQPARSGRSNGKLPHVDAARLNGKAPHDDPPAGGA
jgi:capsular exopolysaccharide synthesis family protein